MCQNYYNLITVIIIIIISIPFLVIFTEALGTTSTITPVGINGTVLWFLAHYLELFRAIGRGTVLFRAGCSQFSAD